LALAQQGRDVRWPRRCCPQVSHFEYNVYPTTRQTDTRPILCRFPLYRVGQKVMPRTRGHNSYRGGETSCKLLYSVPLPTYISAYLAMGRDMPPKKLVLSPGESGTQPNTFPWAERSPSQRHLDRFIRFLLGSRLYPTDRHTDHATSVAIGRISWFTQRCRLIITL